MPVVILDRQNYASTVYWPFLVSNLFFVFLLAVASLYPTTLFACSSLEHPHSYSSPFTSPPYVVPLPIALSQKINLPPAL